MLTGPEVFERLTLTCGYTIEEYQSWLTGVLARSLLEPG